MSGKKLIHHGQATRMLSWLLLLATTVVVKVEAAGSGRVCTQTEHFQDHPVLCQMLEQLAQNPDAMALQIYEHAVENNLLVGHSWTAEATQNSAVTKRRRLGQAKEKQRPVVFAHGMGDSCFNPGMQNVVQWASELLGGVYSVCIPTGANQAEDTSNGYFLNMDANVDIFAAAIANDTHLQDGFDAIGFSQGNNVIRGYLAKYNAPKVHSFISVNGVNAGVGAVPHCRPNKVHSSSLRLGNMCELLMEQASRAAYTDFAQEHSFQANYWRDPRPSAFGRYQHYAQLAIWNNEADTPANQTLNQNWAKTEKFVWVLATEDTMVFPREGEHWAAPNPDDPFGEVLPYDQTEWFQSDLFGLRTADEAGKNYWETFEGDHLQFSKEDFERWLHTYLTV